MSSGLTDEEIKALVVKQLTAKMKSRVVALMKQELRADPEMPVEVFAGRLSEALAAEMLSEVIAETKLYGVRSKLDPKARRGRKRFDKELPDLKAVFKRFIGDYMAEIDFEKFREEYKRNHL